MAIESQESTAVLEFENEDARQAAMDGVEETPENEAKIDAIMKAPIKAKDDAAAQKTADSTPEGTASPAPKEEETPAASASPAASTQASTDGEFIQIKKSDLPQGFDTPGKLFKSYSEAQELITRQQKFIKEKLNGGASADTSVQSVIERTRALEAENAELKKKIEAPAQRETKQDGLSAIPESKIGEIKQVRGRLQELANDPIANEEEIYSLRLKLDDLWLTESERNAVMIQRATKRAEEAERKAIEAHSTASSYVERSAQGEKQKQAQDALAKEYRDIDTFAGAAKYSEFKMTRSAAEVEREYAGWAQDVTNLYFGAPVNIDTDQGRQAMRQAMSMLQKGAPDITEKCRVAGVPIEATEDVKRYLEICDLLDYRDGYRVDPVSGNKEIVKRYHAPSGQYVPDTFPSLEAAYEDRKIRDGFYEKKIRDAFAKGGASMASAIQKRDSGAVEMDVSTGSSRADAGLAMTRDAAVRILDEVDEIEAMRQKRSGNPALWNKLNEAYRALGQKPLE